MTTVDGSTTGTPVDTVCVLDVGTTGVRAALVDERGEVRCIEYADYPVAYPQPGNAEQDPWDVWDGAVGVLRAVAGAAGEHGHRIRAVAMSTQRATVAGIGGDGAPTTPFLLWMDQRGRAEIDAFRDQVGEAAFRAVTGMPADPMISLAKILWLRSNQPSTFAAATRFIGVQEWVLARLGCSDPPADSSCASWVGLYDRAYGGWSDRLLAAADIPSERLSRVASSTERVGEVSTDAAETTGLPAGTPVFAGGGDQQCSAAGGGGVSPGVVTLNLGTSAVLLTPAEQPGEDDGAGLVVSAHVVRGLAAVEGTVPACGSVLRWLASLLGYAHNQDAYPAMMAEAGTVPVGASGLRFEPTVLGLGAPHWRRRAGTMAGLTLAHGSKELVRAALEGIAYQVRDALESVTPYASARRAGASEIRLLGGGARSGVFCQLLADVLSRDLVLPAGDPAAAALRGAAACAWVGLGVHPSLEATARVMTPVDRVYRQEQAAAARYEELFSAYQHTVHAERIDDQHDTTDGLVERT